MRPKAALSTILLVSQPWLATAWLAGAVLRDRWLLTALLFYIPALLVLASGALWLWYYRGRAARLARWVVAPFTCVALIKMLAVDISWRSSFGRPTRSIRVVHWNVAHGRVGPERFLDVLRADEGDVYLLSEFPADPRFNSFGKTLMPDGFQAQHAGMLLVSRFPMGPVEDVPIRNGEAWGVRLAPQHVGGMDFLAVDLDSNPFCLRRDACETLAQWAGRRNRARPLLVLGDFNLPRDSIHLEPLRRYVWNGYERRGARQWPYTWPRFLPLYAVDQAWLSQVRLYNYDLRWNRLSDHARQVLDVFPVMPRY